METGVSSRKIECLPHRARRFVASSVRCRSLLENRMRLFSCVVLAALVTGLVAEFVAGPALAAEIDAAKLGQKIADVTLADGTAQEDSAARPGRHEGDRRRLPVV